ncbi:MAG TPA: sugar transferase [Streptosporangiaceae bacterium]|nr:sugar transferase [Streptosporangiaceae bacterium]
MTITHIARGTASARTATRGQTGQAGRPAQASRHPGPGWRHAFARGVWMLAGGDVIALTLAVVVAGATPAIAACYGLLALCAIATAGLYRPRIGGRAGDQAGRLAMAGAFPALGLLPWAGEHLTVRLAVIAAVLLIVMRMGVDASQRSARGRGLLTQQTLIIGTGAASRTVWRLLREHPELGHRPFGPLPDDLAGDARAVGELLVRFDVSQVLMCVPVRAVAGHAAVLRTCRDQGVRVSVLPQLPELGLAVPRACLDEVWGIPFVPLRPGPQAPGRRAATRLIDLTVGSVLLLAAAPLTLALMLAVWLDLRLPPLFRQVRVVGCGRLAKIAKLRTLRPGGDPDTTWAVTPGQATWFGRLLRGTHADELPQLASVVRGDMALVGPRPERPHFARQLSGSIAGYAARERVRGGLTGWAQVHGLTGDTSLEDRARFDNFYIEYWSVWLDLLILVRTGLGALSGALTAGGAR